jgi:bifunctional DNA-binding transcriptional regulator/antitoxin component of YhaV-PrlF toxin-antitoxin module
MRDRLGIGRGGRVEFHSAPDRRIVLVNAGTPAPSSRFDRFIGHAEPGMTTDEAMAMTRGED